MSNNTLVFESSKIFFVEGEVDGYFIESLLRHYNLRLGLTPEPKRGVGNLRKKLIGADFRKKLSEGKITRFGIVADADSLVQDGAGFNNRWSQLVQDLTPILNDLGMTIPTTKNFKHGEVFSNADASLRIGFWLMPNHQDDGCLEDFVLASTNLDLPLLPGHPKNQGMLKQYADGCWQALEEENLKLFKDYHHSKASAYTWLAWQEKPTQFLSGTIDAGLLNMQHPYVLAFKGWVERCF